MTHVVTFSGDNTGLLSFFKESNMGVVYIVAVDTRDINKVTIPC